MALTVSIDRSHEAPVLLARLIEARTLR